MGRWSDRYRHAALRADTVDTVDTVAPQAPNPPHSVNSVNSVNSVTGAAYRESDIEAAYGSAERAAIIAEGNPFAAVPHAMPVSWADATIEPTAGAYCRNCTGRMWWCEAAHPKGWRCARCHPADHLPPDQRREVRT